MHTKIKAKLKRTNLTRNFSWLTSQSLARVNSLLDLLGSSGFQYLRLNFCKTVKHFFHRSSSRGRRSFQTQPSTDEHISEKVLVRPKATDRSTNVYLYTATKPYTKSVEHVLSIFFIALNSYKGLSGQTSYNG